MKLLIRKHLWHECSRLRIQFQFFISCINSLINKVQSLMISVLYQEVAGGNFLRACTFISAKLTVSIICIKLYFISIKSKKKNALKLQDNNTIDMIKRPWTILALTREVFVCLKMFQVYKELQFCLILTKDQFVYWKLFIQDNPALNWKH